MRLAAPLVLLLLGAVRQDERQLLKDARAALRSGDYDKAGRLAERLAALRPGSWEPRRLQARALLETGKLDEAAAVCREFLKGAPEHAGARAALAETRIESDDPAQALETLGTPATVQGRTLRARALLDLGRDDEALKVVEPFVEEHNRRREDFMKEDLLALARGLILYANLAMDAESYKRVVRSLSIEILKADPQDPVVKTFLGDCYLERHNKDAAQRCYREALEVNRRFVPALLGLAEHAIVSGQPAGAAPFVEAALGVDPSSSRAHGLRALAAIQTQNPAAAREALARGLAARPKSPRLRSLLAAVAHLQEKTDERDAEVRKVLEANPRSPLPYFEIGRALLAAGWQFQSANLFFRKAAEQNPRWWPALVEYGTNCLRLGDEETAGRILRDAGKKDPFNVRVQNLVNLLDDFEKKFAALAPPHYRVRLGKDEQPWMEPYVLELLDKAWADMSKRYGFSPKEPVLVEVFANHSDFSVRCTGVPGLGALGICFGPVVASLSPRARGQVGTAYNWGAVLWHEMAHVFAVQLSEYRVPRWLTEGLSTYEEGLAFGGWERDIELEMMLARRKGDLGGVTGLESGAPAANPILAMYHQGSWICEYIDKTHGFGAIVKLLRGYAARKRTPELFKEVFDTTLADFDKGFFAWMDARIAKNLYRLPQTEPVAKLQADFAAKREAATAMKLCAALLDKDDAEGAVRMGAEAVALAPDDPKARALHGQALYARRRVEEAIPELERGTKDDPADWQTWTALGNATMDENRPKDAARAFERARACFPKLISGENSYRKLNEAHVAMKDYEAAIRDLEEMLAVDQLDFRNRLKVADLRAERGEWDRARRVLEEAAWIETRDRTLHRLLARAYAEAKADGRALRHYGIVLALIEAGETSDESQDKADTFCDLGEIHLRMGDREKARGYAQDALRLMPGHDRARKLFERTRP